VTGPRRVLFVDHARAMGGAETSLLILMRNLDPERYQPVLIGQAGVLMDRASAAGIEAHSLPMPRLRASVRAPLHLARFALELRKLADGQGASLVHATVLRAALYAAPAARVARLPMIWHVRDILQPGRSSSALCASAAEVLAISQAVAQVLPCAKRARVIHNPIEASDPPISGRQALGLPESGELVASVGRLRRWKGHHRFLELAATIAPAQPDTRFLVIGGRIFTEDDSDADYPDFLRAEAIRLGIADRVDFLGHREDLDAIWPHLSALVHVGDPEPFGRVVAEAQAAGVPALGFAEGGLPEIIDHEESGLLLKAGDLEGMAEALVTLLDDAKRRERMSANARRSATRRFSPAKHAAAVQSVYDSLFVPTSPGES
jgi:glycosyltransferase involved in cell wall biosynthesis